MVRPHRYFATGLFVMIMLVCGDAARAARYKCIFYSLDRGNCRIAAQGAPRDEAERRAAIMEAAERVGAAVGASEHLLAITDYTPQIPERGVSAFYGLEDRFTVTSGSVQKLTLETIRVTPYPFQCGVIVHNPTAGNCLLRSWETALRFALYHEYAHDLFGYGRSPADERHCDEFAWRFFSDDDCFPLAEE